MTLRSKHDSLAWLRAGVLVPVIRADSAAVAERVTEALVAGGVRTIEITMTVPDALAVIRSVAARFGTDVLLGAGTVTDRTMALDALEAGAQFLVTPCVVAEVIAAAREHGVAVSPGAMTPTEVFSAWSQGGDIVKVFPSTALGPAFIKDLRAPLPQVKLMPTGGVSIDNAVEWLRAGAVAVGIGSALVDAASVKAGDFAGITLRAERLVANVHGRGRLMPDRSRISRA